MGGETCFLYKIDDESLQEYAAFSETIRAPLEGEHTLTIVLNPNAEHQDFSLDYLTFDEENQQDFIKTVNTIKFVGNVKFLKRGLNTMNFEEIFENLKNITFPPQEEGKKFPGLFPEAFSGVTLTVEHTEPLEVEEEIPGLLEGCIEAQNLTAEKKRRKEARTAAAQRNVPNNDMTNEDRARLYEVTQNWTGNLGEGQITLKKGERVIVEGGPDNRGMVQGRRVDHSGNQVVSGKFPSNIVKKIEMTAGGGGKKRRTYKKGKKSKRRNTRRRNSRRRSRRNNKSK